LAFTFQLPKTKAMTNTTIPYLIDNLLQIREATLEEEHKYEDLIQNIHPNHQLSARNFIRYLKLRTFDLREVQDQLCNLGLSSFGHSERYALANLENILHFLTLHEQAEKATLYALDERPLNFFKSREILQNNTKRLLGNSHGRLHTRIMVTLPTEAAVDFKLVRNLVEAGMDTARINCSHDDPDVWKGMIKNVKKAETQTGYHCKIYMDLAGPKLRTGPIQVKTTKKKKKKKPINYITLHEGDLLQIRRNPTIGRNAKYDDAKQLIKPAKISLTIPSVLDDVEIGQQIWFDDGNIGGLITDRTEKGIDVRIHRASIKGSRLRPEKGVNFPDSDLNLPSLTKEDLKNLPFIVENADMVGYSFVRRPEDVESLQRRLKKLGRPDIGLVLKIETREAFDNLPMLLLTGMQNPILGVMIARGDLAVEVGMERISEVQEEMLWLCEAAHVPIIWATQVLEKLAKEGVPTRAEITDASMAGRAECVMLNKGAYILEAVRSLGNILHRMEAHRQKNKGSLRSLQVAQRFCASMPLKGEFIG
jgi:pyruvate kinase